MTVSFGNANILQMIYILTIHHILFLVWLSCSLVLFSFNVLPLGNILRDLATDLQSYGMQMIRSCSSI